MPCMDWRVDSARNVLKVVGHALHGHATDASSPASPPPPARVHRCPRHDDQRLALPMAHFPTLLWFRHDLRLADHPALVAALHRGGPIIPVFLWTPEEEGDWCPGGASRWWLHHSLARLSQDLQTRGARLVIRQGPSLETLRKLIRETGARSVFWTERYEPAIALRDSQILAALRADGLEASAFPGGLLTAPHLLRNKSGRPFQVFTPFWKHCLSVCTPAPPQAAPAHWNSPAKWPPGLALDTLELLPRIPWDTGLKARWQPGEVGAREQLDRFLQQSFSRYADERNRPDLPGTSRLSPHLHFGEISPRQIWFALQSKAEQAGWPPQTWRSSSFVSELGWREFSHHLLVHFPHTPTAPLRAEFDRFPWRNQPEWLAAWQKGQTGYPIVDAGMRELWHTGWMHNRVRMIAASFLVKDLLIHWREGASWFWDTLVDADLAQNTLGWQWTAGCGADAAPYFRVFNPTSQGEKFDPEGNYARQWLPELAGLPAHWIHRPHEAPMDILAAARLKLGSDYPLPIVSHALARNVALDAFARLKM